MNHETTGEPAADPEGQALRVHRSRADSEASDPGARPTEDIPGRDTAVEEGRAMIGRMSSVVRSHPAASFGIAAAVGMFLGAASRGQGKRGLSVLGAVVSAAAAAALQVASTVVVTRIASWVAGEDSRAEARPGPSGPSAAQAPRAGDAP